MTTFWALGFVLGIWLLAWVILFGLPRWHQRYVVHQGIPDAWEQQLREVLPIYAHLPAALQRQLQERIALFIDQVRFVACAGFRIDDRVRLAIAGQACLLLLNRPEPRFHNLHAVYVYPTAFIAEREQIDEAGVVQRETQELLGESWSDGRIILAWDEIEHGLGHLHNDMSVVLHEFAHHLDHSGGYANGAPWLGSEGAYRSWHAAMSEAYKTLQHRHDGVIDVYGAEDPAEFFAVSTEAFFLRPDALAAHYPKVFAELARYYRLDPRDWY